MNSFLPEKALVSQHDGSICLDRKNSAVCTVGAFEFSVLIWELTGYFMSSRFTYAFNAKYFLSFKTPFCFSRRQKKHKDDLQI